MIVVHHRLLSSWYDDVRFPDGAWGDRASAMG